jgi:hypothetical protein
MQIPKVQCGKQREISYKYILSELDGGLSDDDISYADYTCYRYIDIEL